MPYADVVEGKPDSTTVCALKLMLKCKSSLASTRMDVVKTGWHSSVQTDPLVRAVPRNTSVAVVAVGEKGWGRGTGLWRGGGRMGGEG